MEGTIALMRESLVAWAIGLPMWDNPDTVEQFNATRAKIDSIANRIQHEPGWLERFLCILKCSCPKAGQRHRAPLQVTRKAVQDFGYSILVEATIVTGETALLEQALKVFQMRISHEEATNFSSSNSKATAEILNHAKNDVLPDAKPRRKRTKKSIRNAK